MEKQKYNYQVHHIFGLLHQKYQQLNKMVYWVHIKLKMIYY